MPELSIAGPDAPPEDIRMFQRPQPINDEIRQLLKNGTVADLYTEKGKFLRSMFTESEVDASMSLPMPECLGFDGVACDFCRGMYRFSNCERCHGLFDQTIHGWPGEPGPNMNVPRPVAPTKQQTGTFRRFLGKFGIR